MHRSFAFGFCLATVTASATAAQTSAPRPLSIEDFYRVRAVGSPAISPDGRTVAYTVVTRHEANNADSSAVWLVPTDGASVSRRVSAPGTHATSPAWDGQ